MRKNAYVTYTKYVSEQSGKISRNRTINVGWKIKSLGNNILCLAPFPEIEEKPEIFINLTNSFEFNTPKGTDSQGNTYIVEYWINPQARIGELVQLRMNKFQPIGKEEIIITRIDNYRGMAWLFIWRKKFDLGRLLAVYVMTREREYSWGDFNNDMLKMEVL